MPADARNQKVVDAIVEATRAGLEMADVRARMIRAEPAEVREVTVHLQLKGEHMYTLTLNMGAVAAKFISSRLMFEEYSEVNDDVLDATGEVANILAGSLLGSLTEAGISVQTLGLPTASVGQGLNEHAAEGVHVVFEIDELDDTEARDRLISVIVSHRAA